MPSYAVELTTRYDGLVIASFPDLPGVTALGVDDEDARAEARRALEEALLVISREGRAPPEARSPGGARIEVRNLARPVPA